MTLKIKLAFLIETTPAMTDCLEDVTYEIESILNQTKFYNPEADIQVGCVCYRDYRDADQLGGESFCSPEEFMKLLEKESLYERSCVASFSRDDVADVAGGLRLLRTFLNWGDPDIRLIHHFAISPPHGEHFHNSKRNDSFPQGDPNKLNPLEDMAELSKANYHYTFHRIDSEVDTMLEQFDQVYTGPGKFEVNQLEITATYISEPDSQ